MKQTQHQMKDSGIEWIGKIPEHWEIRRLKFVSRIKYGNSLAEEDRIAGDVKVYGSNGVIGTHNTPISESETIVIGRKGSFGKLNYSDAPCFPIDTTFFIDST